MLKSKLKNKKIKQTKINLKYLKKKNNIKKKWKNFRKKKVHVNRK